MFKCFWAGVQDNARGETITQWIAQPCQALRIMSAHGCCSLYLDSNYFPARELGYEVDFLATMQ